MHASIAQLAEHSLSKRKVASSILAGGFPLPPRYVFLLARQLNIKLQLFFIALRLQQAPVVQ